MKWSNAAAFCAGVGGVVYAMAVDMIVFAWCCTCPEDLEEMYLDVGVLCAVTRIVPIDRLDNSNSKFGASEFRQQ